MRSFWPALGLLVSLVVFGCGGGPSVPSGSGSKSAGSGTEKGPDRKIKWSGLDTPYKGTTVIHSDGTVENHTGE